MEKIVEDQIKFIRIKSVLSRTGLKRSTIYKYIKQGRFPKPVNISPKCAAWVESEINDWMLLKISQRA